MLHNALELNTIPRISVAKTTAPVRGGHHPQRLLSSRLRVIVACGAPRRGIPLPPCVRVEGAHVGVVPCIPVLGVRAGGGWAGA